MLCSRILKCLYSAFPLLFLLSFMLPSPAFAQSEEEKAFLLMYFKEDELQVISTTRSLKSITRVAENVEIVTASDIELMNAHTLGDVLNTINGVQVVFGGAAPGSVALVQIQASRSEHVAILVDGVRPNDIAGGGTADASLIPVQLIDKVEVIKGPASSAWGSSLGGIVNVITKSPPADGTHGVLSASYGERNTGDFRVELSGRKDSFGYYFYAGRLQTDGLRTHDDNNRNNIYAKLTYDFSKDTRATFTFLYNKAENAQGDFEDLGLRFDTKDELILSSLSVRSRLTDDLSIEVSGRAEKKSTDGSTTDLLSEAVFRDSSADKKYGGSVKVDFRYGVNSFVFGGDYDFLRTKATFLGDRSFEENIAALYINDTLSLGKLTIIPGLRFDSVDVEGTSLKESTFSPSLGVTYEIAPKTILRGFLARGFNIPPIVALFADDIFFVKNLDLKLEKVWSYQIGVETGALKYVWLKASGFRHDIRDAITREDISIDDGSWTLINKDKVRRQGFEAEIKSLTVYNFTLSAAAAYMNSKDLETDETIRDNPEYTYDVALRYDDRKSFRALLKGRYIWWNSSGELNARYNAFIFDINAIKIFCKRPSYTAEAFLNIHNIFNGSQYWIENFKNARRWVEGGIRVSF